MIQQAITLRCDECLAATFQTVSRFGAKQARNRAAVYGWFSIWRTRNGKRKMADVCPGCVRKLMSDKKGKEGAVA